MRAALTDDCFLNWRTTTTTLAFFLIERAQTVGKAAAHSVDAFVHHVNARPTDGNRARQDLANRAIQPTALGARQRFGLAERVQPRVP